MSELQIALAWLKYRGEVAMAVLTITDPGLAQALQEY